MKTLNDITLYDLMAEDMTVWLGKNNKFGYDLQIEDENYKPLIDEKGLHPYAADGLADFCERYLACYNRLNRKEAA